MNQSRHDSPWIGSNRISKKRAMMRYSPFISFINWKEKQFILFTRRKNVSFFHIQKTKPFFNGRTNYNFLLRFQFLNVTMTFSMFVTPVTRFIPDDRGKTEQNFFYLILPLIPTLCDSDGKKRNSRWQNQTMEHCGQTEGKIETQSWLIFWLWSRQRSFIPPPSLPQIYVSHQALTTLWGLSIPSNFPVLFCLFCQSTFIYDVSTWLIRKITDIANKLRAP